MIPVEIAGLQLEASTGSPVLLLRETTDQRRVLPVFIGHTEARAIAVSLEKLIPPRPMTHDLLITVLQRAGTELRRVEVTALRDGTFFAELELAGPRGVLRVSSRPSDAVALAVRAGVPIFASPEVLDEAGAVVADEDDTAVIEEAVAEFREFLDELDPADFEHGPEDPEAPPEGPPEGPPEATG